MKYRKEIFPIGNGKPIVIRPWAKAYVIGTDDEGRQVMTQYENVSDAETRVSDMPENWKRRGEIIINVSPRCITFLPAEPTFA